MKTNIAAIAVLALVASSAHAIGWDSDDFILACPNDNRVSIFDVDLTFKGHLSAPLNFPMGMDFDNNGNLVVVSGGRWLGLPAVFSVFNPQGDLLRQFQLTGPWAPGDLEVGPNGNYYLAVDGGPLEISPTGNVLRDYVPNDDSTRYGGVAITSANVLVTAQDTIRSGIVDDLKFFDVGTGALIRSMPANIPRQEHVFSIFYDRKTDTLLMTDFQGSADVSEHTTTGEFIRSFKAEGFRVVPGVVRGPDGKVFAPDDSTGQVHIWSADGTWIEDRQLTNIGSVGPIVWAGNAVPEPSAFILAVCGVVLGFRQNWSMRHMHARPR